MMKDIKPPLTDSLPKVGPTTCSCTIFAGAGSLPVFNIFERSCASSTVKLPVMLERPPAIRSLGAGAE